MIRVERRTWELGKNVEVEEDVKSKLKWNGKLRQHISTSTRIFSIILFFIFWEISQLPSSYYFSSCSATSSGRRVFYLFNWLHSKDITFSSLHFPLCPFIHSFTHLTLFGSLLLSCHIFISFEAKHVSLLWAPTKRLEDGNSLSGMMSEWHTENNKSRNYWKAFHNSLHRTFLLKFRTINYFMVG